MKEKSSIYKSCSNCKYHRFASSEQNSNYGENFCNNYQLEGDWSEYDDFMMSNFVCRDSGRKYWKEKQR